MRRIVEDGLQIEHPSYWDPEEGNPNEWVMDPLESAALEDVLRGMGIDLDPPFLELFPADSDPDGDPDA